MGQVVQVKRRTTGVPGSPGTLATAELAYNSAGQELYVGDGAGAPQALVSASRQVELTGNQTIAVGSRKTIDVADLVLTGGVTGNVLRTDGYGNLSWIASPTIPATNAEMVAGTLSGVFATPLNMMALNGAQVTTLTTVAKTIVPAINELKTTLDSYALANIFVGSFNATAGTIAWTAASGGTGSALPTPAPGNLGWYLVCDVAGSTPGASFPVGPYLVGDWVISDGAAWTRLAFGSSFAAPSASAVTVAPPVMGQSDVQSALEALDTAGALDEAPDDDVTYGRRGPTTAAWEHVVAAAGDTMTGALTVTMAAPSISLNKPASGTSAAFWGKTTTTNRWALALGDNAAESGANAGSNFALTRYSDAGSSIDVPLAISRATGVVDFTVTPTVAGVPISAGGGGLSTVEVTEPALTGDGSVATPVTFTGIVVAAAFTGNGLTATPLNLASVDGGTY